MKEFIALLLNTMIYPLLFCLILFLIIEAITFFSEKRFLNMNPKKKGFYIILFGTVIFWSLVVSFVKWLI